MYSFVSSRHFGALLLLLCVAVVLTNAQSPSASADSSVSEESSSSSGSDAGTGVKYPQELPCKDNADTLSLHGETYKMTPCSRCTCTNSTLSCEFETCQPTTCYEPLTFEEECCKWCPYNVTVTEVTPLLPGAQSIQEGRAENDLNVNLDVTYVNNREATSVKGQALWQTRMWMSSEADGSTELPGTVVENVLTEGQQSQDLLKRGPSTQFLINDIRYKVDMSDLTCADARYLCAKFNKGENPEVEKEILTFYFEGKPTEKALTGCSPIGDCKGGALVQVNNVAPMMQENTVVVEGNPNQVMVDLGVNYVDSDQTTDVTGQDLWTASLWLSGREDGSRPIRGTEVKEVLTPGMSSQDLIKDPTATFNINSIPYNFDLTGKTCSEAKYLCARFDKNKNAKPSKEYSSFKFEGVPNTRALTGCSLIDNCRGVTFDEMTWSRDVGQMQYGLPAPLTIDAQVTTTADSPPVEGTRLWKMNLFGSRSVNGSGVRLNERSQILDGYNQAKSLAGGGAPLEFEGVAANYPLEDLGCGEYKFLCLEFTKGDYARPDYTYATTSGKQSIINCLPEKCRAVYVSGVNSQLTSADLYEGRPNNMVQFDTIVQTTDESSPVVGRNMWRLNLYGSENPDGSGPRQAPQEQVLSDYYSSRELTVPGSTLNFQPINTEFDMTNINCKKLKYLCTEFSRNPESSEEFELNPVPDESVLRDCMEVSDEMCQGVVIDDMDWTMDILTDEVASGRPTPVRFDIDVEPRPNTGSASGENLWRIGMFGSTRPDGRGPRIGPERQILTRDESGQDLTSGQKLRFSDVESEFDLSAVGCETEYQYLCLEYAKGLRAEPDFKFRAADGGEVVTKCKEQECRKGVKISGLNVDGNDNSVLRENEPYNRVMFDMTGITTPDSGGVDGDNLWDLKLYGSNYETGYGPRLNEQNVELNSYQRNKDVFPGEDIDFGMIDTNYNMNGLTCKDVRYLCAELSKNPRANPPFDLQAVPDRSVMKKCFPQKCDGIIVDNIELGGDFIVDENTDEIELDVTVYSNPSSGDASGRRLWRLETFTANNRDGTGNRRMLERETLSPSEASRELRSGSKINFDNIAARINKDDIPCEEGGGYVCVELSRGDAPSIDYTLSGSRPDSLKKCQKINCKKAVEAVPGTPGDPGPPGEPAKLPREWTQGTPGLPGPAGPPGYSGPNGYPGLSGVPGIKGPSGNSGPNGYPGTPGRPGSPGPPGESVAPTYQQQYGSKSMGGYTGGYGAQQIVQGPPGPPGPPGKQGDRGAQGLRGSGGDSGSTGPAGPVGPAGPRGADGDDGRDGSNGSPGSLGAAGPQGASGAMGANGAPGQQGHKGWRGARGRKGLRGDTGDAGDAGNDGAVGPAGVVGARGETGATGGRGERGGRGAVGARGDDGDDGDAGAAGQQGGPGIRGAIGQGGFKGDAGATGDIGQPGIQGLLGEGGSDGAPGAAGAFGNPGKDGAAGAIGDVGGAGGPGPAGLAGARGSSGNRGGPGVGGEPGSVGYPGQAGARGLAGTRGARGTTGPVGAPGSDGSDGSPGADGSSGPAGAAGQRGELGSPGGLGPGGLSGPNGMQGDVGPQGASGIPGEKGDNGAAGRNGNAGAPGQRGAEGSEGRDGNDGKPGPAGSPGNDGKPGPQGASGVRGNRGGPGPGGVAGQAGEDGRLGSQGTAGARGPRGAEGVEGGPGPTGPAGAQGARGDSGPQGPAGPIGPNGGVGMPGSRGAGGRRGVPGPAGNAGQGGAQGAPGERGPTGSMGLAGASGEGGPSGPDGRDGRDGEPGSKGSPGDVGRIGVPGLSGAPGDRGGIGGVGNAGAPGAQGTSGKRGDAGGQGARGNPGPPGPAGSPGLSGESGDVGRSGRTGPQGTKGKQGEKGRPGERGTQGIPGGPGPQGPVGARGEKGSKGAVGDQGPEGGVGGDGRAGALGATGAKGARGEPGEQGALGAGGNSGPSGMPGPTGAPGARGAVGGPGSNGRSGPPGRRGGAGQQGAQGIRGVPGTQGQSGSRGNDGRSGSAGPAGLAGPAGPLGILGELGGMGAMGAPGATGPAGRPGADGSSGKRGSSGSNGPTGPMGAQGAKGARGSAGDEGRDGKDGPEGPQGATGLDGDKGPQGGQGSAGVAGLPGRQGPAGGPGERGSRGSAGPAGSRGSSGPDGNVGPAGPAGPAGARGETGGTGIMGHKGWGGSPGAPGGQGPKGPSGGRGERGRSGSSGPPGIDGARGRNGKSGVQGPRGMAGSGGQRGPSGRVGASGPPGAPGPAGAPGALSYSQGYAYSGPSSSGGGKGQNPYGGYYGDDAEIEEDDYEARIKQLRVRIMKLMLPNGEPEYPARSCKDIFKCYPYFPSGYYTLDPSGGSGYDKFVAYCDKKTNATCISPDITKIPRGTYYLGDTEEPVDFSSMRNGSEIPYSVKPVQLTLLRLMYLEATQNITYHCKNSHAVADHQGRVDKAVTLIGPNDVRMNIADTRKDLQYNVEGQDGCQTQNDAWGQTTISYTTKKTERLPLVDFAVRDIGRSKQKFGVDIGPVCFF